MRIVDVWGVRLKLNRVSPITIFELHLINPIKSNLVLGLWWSVSSGHLLKQAFTMLDVSVADIEIDLS
jgi:hypothetical protein